LATVNVRCDHTARPVSTQLNWRRALWSVNWPVELSRVGQCDYSTNSTQLDKTSPVSVSHKVLNVVRILRLAANWRLFCQVEF